MTYVLQGSDKQSEVRIKKFMTMMDSMTEKELNTNDIKILQQPSRVQRISRGAGRTPQDYYDLLGEFETHRSLAHESICDTTHTYANAYAVQSRTECTIAVAVADASALWVGLVNENVTYTFMQCSKDQSQSGFPACHKKSHCDMMQQCISQGAVQPPQNDYVLVGESECHVQCHIHLPTLQDI